MKAFFLIFMIWLCLYAEVRTIKEDDGYSIQKKEFLKKLQERKPVYADLFPAWKDVTTFEAKHYQADLVATRSHEAPLSSDLYFLLGDSLNGLAGEFQCEENLCPIVFGVKRHSGASQKTREYFNSNDFYNFTFSEWIVLELKTPEKGILHFMERACSLEVQKSETKLVILNKEKCETQKPLNFITTEYYPPHLFPTSFDCDRAENTSEKVICSYGQLADLDRQIDAYYQTIVPYYPPMKVKQIEWMKERNTCEMSKDCLIETLLNRSRDLSQFLANLIENRMIH